MDDEVQPFVKQRLFLPEGRCSHCIVQVNGSEISAITVRQLKLDTNKIIEDHKKRMLPRFRSVMVMGLFLCYFALVRLNQKLIEAFSVR